MKKFYVMWGYMANWSQKPEVVEAETASEAAQKMRDYYASNEQFVRLAEVFVFEAPPVLIKRGQSLPETDNLVMRYTIK